MALATEAAGASLAAAGAEPRLEGQVMGRETPEVLVVAVLAVLAVLPMEAMGVVLGLVMAAVVAAVAVYLFVGEVQYEKSFD